MQMMFENQFLSAIKNAVEIAKQFEITVSTPLILFKGIIDLDDSPIYDYLIENTCYENADFEDCFIQILYDCGLINEETILEKDGESKDNKEDSSTEQTDSVTEEIGKSQSEEDKKNKTTEYQFNILRSGEVLYYDKATAELIGRAIQITKEEKGEMVRLSYLLQAMTENTISKDILHFLRNLSIDIKDFKKVFSGSTNDSKSGQNIIPSDLRSCMQIMNDKVNKSRKCPILGRDKECSILWTILQKKTKRNAILIGKPGVGKTSIVKKITDDIVRGKCPEEFKDFLVVSLDVSGIIADTTYRGEAEKKFESLNKFLTENTNVILFIDEIHLILGAGATMESSLDLANSLKPILADDTARVIGATTTEEYEKHFSRDGAVKRRFKPIEVNEPKANEVYPMIKNAVAELSKHHGIRISKSMIDFIILTSACFNYETKNPDRTLDLIDLSMVTAKNNQKKCVDKESVLQNFNLNIEHFKKMEISSKRALAYHEAGHYIVWRMSGKLTERHVIAVSIMPAEEYLGVNVYEYTDEDMSIKAYFDYFIDKIALDLGGRVAEKMYTGDIGAGASSDLMHATGTAYDIVSKYGMCSEVGLNRVYTNDKEFQMINSSKTDEINKAIDEIISKAEKRAEQILKDNEKILKKMVNLLMKKGILDEKELDKLFLETQKQMVTIK